MSNVIKELNQIQADAYVMFLKLHNFHWNVKGLQFFAIHEYTESAYDAMSEIFDATAERAIQLGKDAMVTNKKLIEKSKIKESSKTSFTTQEVLSAIEEDYKYFLKSFRKLSNEAAKADDNTTVAFADENIAKLEKDLWMLKATLSK